jgi:hypothetical protein
MIWRTRARQNATECRCKAALAALARFASVLFCTVALANSAAAATTDPVSEVEAAVITHLKDNGFTDPKIVSRTDLTSPFATNSAWTLVIAQDNSAPPEISDLEDRGPIAICFVKELAPDCSEKLYQAVPSEQRWFGTPFYIRDSRVVYAGPGKKRPLLLLKVCGARSGDGNCSIATGLFDYDRGADRFHKVFGNVTGSNNNQETRFIDSGPLLGDVVVDQPTDNAPYAYWIEIYRMADSGRYSRVLRYRSMTRYADGNALAVIDSDMPELLRRLGLWRIADPLPVPNNTEKCTHPVMRKGEEWCN